MSNVQWGEFKLTDLFELYMGKNISKKDIKESGIIPLVTGQTENNGVAGYLEVIPDESRVQDKSLTLTTRGEYSGTSFYQEDYFYAGNNVMVLNPKCNLSKEGMLYLKTVIDKLPYGGYDNYPTLRSTQEDKIKIPVTPEGIPDWEYMENYIREKQQQVKLRLEQLTSINETPKKLVYSELEGGGRSLDWERVSLRDVLGESRRGKRLKKADRVVGEIPLVTAGYINTGVAELISGKEGMELFGNSITIDMFGNCFYRDYDFYADDNILVVSKEGLTKQQYLYLATVIGNETRGFDYTTQYRKKDYDAQEVTIPFNTVTKEVDWEYMEDFIKEKQRLVSERLNTLLKVSENEKELVYG